MTKTRIPEHAEHINSQEERANAVNGEKKLGSDRQWCSGAAEHAGMPQKRETTQNEPQRERDGAKHCDWWAHQSWAEWADGQGRDGSGVKLHNADFPLEVQEHARVVRKKTAEIVALNSEHGPPLSAHQL